MSKKATSPKKSKSLIRGIRSLQGISQTELAAQLGCSQSKISKVESGVVPLAKTDATQLAEALGVTPETLLPSIEGHHDD